MGEDVLERQGGEALAERPEVADPHSAVHQECFFVSDKEKHLPSAALCDLEGARCDLLNPEPTLWTHFAFS
jgi:hypothetical protein